ncbi:hypothetical protein ACTFIV_003927 [Dictyostelium citrinum]
MSKYKNSSLLNDQSGSRQPSLSSGSSVLGISNQLPPNSLFHLFSTNNQQSTTTPTTVTIQPPSSIISTPSPTANIGGIPTAGSSAVGGGGTTTPTNSNIVVVESNKEDDKECGTILMEINKGIRSGNLGEQIESILFFSHLIKFHPSPLIVNSVITRLSDIFRNTSNTVKYRILKVFQECSSEIHKVSNIEEVLKRIHSVILSNDPIARSLSLRVLGSVPHLIADKLYIHHSIRTCMQSHDQVELEATIFIMDKLCEISPLFSDSIIEKIHTVIQNVETPPITKLKYTRLFRHMHHSHSIATQSKEMLVGLLDLYPSVGFVSVILDTLTNLSLKHILYIDDHIKFLKNYGFSDSRVVVKVIALKCLQKLAIISPHSQFPIIEIFNIIRDTPSKSYREIKYNALLLLSILSQSQNTKILELNQTNDNDLIDILYQYSLDYDFKLSELSIQTLVNIIVESTDNNNNNLIESILNQTVNNICVILKTQFTTSTANNNNENKSSLNKTSIFLKSIIRLIKKDPKPLKSITATIISLLNEIPYSIIKSLFHCLSMCIPMNKSVLNQNGWVKLILDYLNNLIIKENSVQLINYNDANSKSNSNKNIINGNNNDISNRINKQDCKYSIPMSIFMCIYKTFDENNQKIQEITEQLLPLIQYILENPKPDQLWSCYNLAQLSQRHGFHKVAMVIYSTLIHKVESECNYLWLKGLLSIATLENEISIFSITNKNKNTNINNNSKILNQLSNYHTAIVSLKASSQQERSLQFQEDFILLHEKHLFNILNLKSFLLECNDDDDNNINNNSCNEILLKRFLSKSLIFRQLEQKYQLLLTIQSKSINHTVPLDTKQILESFILSCSLIVKLIDLIVINKSINNNNINTNGINNLHQQKQEQEQRYQQQSQNQELINYFPLFKYCEFVQKKLNQQNSSTITNPIPFLNQVLNGLIKIPMVYPSSFYSKF